MQHKCSWRFTGAIYRIYPIESYTDNSGKVRVSRKIIAVNKRKKDNKWIVKYMEFEVIGEAVEQINVLIPGSEVIISYTVKGIFFPKGTKEKFFQKLIAWDIMPNKDRVMPKKWMDAENGDYVKDPSLPDSTMLLTDQRKVDRHPPNRGYDYPDFDPTVDYSDTVKNKAVEPDLPIEKDNNVQSDLPF